MSFSSCASLGLEQINGAQYTRVPIRFISVYFCGGRGGGAQEFQRVYIVYCPIKDGLR